MIYILKSKNGQFYARTENTRNHKILDVTELHTQKQNCWKNLFAIAEEMNSRWFFVTDKSLKNPKNYFCSEGKKFLKPLGEESKIRYK